MTQVIAANLVESKYMENASITLQYTSTNVKTIVDSFKVTNVTGGAVTFDVYVVPNAGTAGASNKFIDAVSVQAGQTYHCPEVVGMTLESGDFISAQASAANSLTFRVGGRTIS